MFNEGAIQIGRILFEPHPRELLISIESLGYNLRFHGHV